MQTYTDLWNFENKKREQKNHGTQIFYYVFQHLLQGLKINSFMNARKQLFLGYYGNISIFMLMKRFNCKTPVQDDTEFIYDYQAGPSIHKERRKE